MKNNEEKLAISNELVQLMLKNLFKEYSSKAIIDTTHYNPNIQIKKEPLLIDNVFEEELFEERFLEPSFAQITCRNTREISGNSQAFRNKHRPIQVQTLSRIKTEPSDEIEEALNQLAQAKIASLKRKSSNEIKSESGNKGFLGCIENSRVLLVHLERISLNNYKPYMCPQCPYKTAKKSHWNRHLYNHIGGKPYRFKCKECSYKTLYKTRMKLHSHHHRGSKKLSESPKHSKPTSYKHNCTECDYKTNQISNLKMHRLKHANFQNTKLLKCTVCGYKTPNKYYLKRHMLCHKNPKEIKMYNCSQCGFQTYKTSTFKKHTMRHTNRKSKNDTEYRCDKCGFTTTFKPTLRQHIRYHNIDVVL